MEDLLQVGAITSTHGVKGEVKIFPMTDDVRRFKKLKQVILDTGKEQKVLEVEGVKFFKQMVIMKFKGFDNPNDIEIYRGKGLFVTRDQAVKCEKDEYFIADLIDCKVIDENNNELGVVDDVLQTGANDVYIVKTKDNKEILIPAIKDCVLNVDMPNKTITIHVMAGLLED